MRLEKKHHLVNWATMCLEKERRVGGGGVVGVRSEGSWVLEQSSPF